MSEAGIKGQSSRTMQDFLGKNTNTVGFPIDFASNVTASTSDHMGRSQYYGPLLVPNYVTAPN